MLKRVTIYFLIPVGVAGTLIAMYFSGNETLQQIISPRMPKMNPSSGREFGLLENLQNLILLAMIVMAAMGFRRKTQRIEKAGMAFVFLFSCFIFLEEIDYGLHFYEYAKNVPWYESTRARNLHNVGDRTNITKRVVDLGMLVAFGILPFALAKTRNPLVRFLLPTRESLLTLLAMLLVRTLAHQLKDHGFGTEGTIDNNLSEFRELVTYYLFMLYLFQITFRRSLFPNEETPEPGP